MYGKLKSFFLKFASKNSCVNMSFHLYTSQSPRPETIDIYITVDVPKRQDSAQQILENTDKHSIFPLCVGLRSFGVLSWAICLLVPEGGMVPWQLRSQECLTFSSYICLGLLYLRV